MFLRPLLPFTLYILLLAIFSPKISISSSKNLNINLSVCQDTLYPELCTSTLSKFSNLQTKSLPQIILTTVNHTLLQAKATSNNIIQLHQQVNNVVDQRDKHALEDCSELLSDTVSHLHDVVYHLSTNSPSKTYHDMQTLLSAAMTNQYTCLDGFSNNFSSIISDHIREGISDISRHVSNSLAMLNKINVTSIIKGGGVENGHPTWLSRNDKMLVEEEEEDETVEYDAVVAKDGSGNFTKIGEAVAAVPDNGRRRFVIKVKEGEYYEYVEVGNTKTNVTLIGDGIGRTVVKGNRSVVDGWSTFRSATFAVIGDGFIAKGMTFENTAGPTKHQAVALRSSSDRSAFYKCSFIGYQDTLYVHSFRQFYRDCHIYGTIDFIFGNAAAVFQHCNIYVRKPLDSQINVVVAHGRQDRYENTGISILSSKISATSDLMPVLSQTKTYLGRPWKLYSRVVVIKSYIGHLIDPKGWLEWDGNFALDTLYFGEYRNRGPGSGTKDRVKWPGYRVIENLKEARQFSVGKFIKGGEWLNGTSIPFSLGLS